MSYISLLRTLFQLKLLTPMRLLRLVYVMLRYGTNVLALLRFATYNYLQETALVDDSSTLSYEQLWEHAYGLALRLRHEYSLRQGHKVGVLCRNHAALVTSIFAISGVGADMYLLNAEMGESQLRALITKHDFDLLLYDEELRGQVVAIAYTKAVLTAEAIHAWMQAGQPSAPRTKRTRLPRTSMGKLVLLTGGTTGTPKTAAHRPSVVNYLHPFIAFVTRLGIARYKTAYIATPIYHGYGIAVLLLSITMGKKIVITRRFTAERACALIHQHRVEFITVVPLMLHKMLQHRPDDLRTLACIASGGAVLSPTLVTTTQQVLGDVLYNLYGTSESGLNIIATPADLRLSPQTVGRPIAGMDLHIVDTHKQIVRTGAIGQLCIRNDWSMHSRHATWIETGDMGYQDEQGLFYILGRADDMVVSAGENVYPIEVERVLLEHPLVADVAVIGVADEAFGQRLRAFVQPRATDTEAGVAESIITTAELLVWLRPRLARYQMPREIVLLDALPYTPVGKLDKKKLRELL